MMLSATTKGEETGSSGYLPPPGQPCRLFSFAEIQSATQNFDEKRCIGRGGFGKVYSGLILDGPTSICAIKRLHSSSDQGAPEFWLEVQMLSRLRHCNLVSLIGYCNDRKEMALVYEYMPHGTLSDRLHKKGTLLTWPQRLKICIGAARGLDYLHTGTGTQHGVIHRDVKSSNILLDENYAAKISDFGLAKIGLTNQTHTYVNTGVKGTFGYMDPSYFSTGRLTRKSDVYAFGVVMLEVLCGRPALDLSLEEGLATWAQERIRQGKITRIIDSSLRDHISRSSLKEFSRIAGRCLLSHPSQRPTMSEVIGSLELALSSQERKDSLAQRGAVVKKAWSFRSLKAPFEFKNWGLTRTLESELVTPPIMVLTEDDLHPTQHLVGQDADSDPLPAIDSLQITDDPFAEGELQEVYNTIESEEIYGDEAVSEIISAPVNNEFATEVEVDQRGPLEGQNANNGRIPAIKDLRITGVPFPGGELQVCGLFVNGATHCTFQWVHTLSDGSSQYIEGATGPTYIVRLGDVGTYLAVEVLPMDVNGRQGNLFKCFVNDGERLK